MCEQFESLKFQRGGKPVQSMQIQKNPEHRRVSVNRGKTALLAALVASMHVPLTAHAIWKGSADASVSTTAFAEYDHDMNSSTPTIQSYDYDTSGYVGNTAATGVFVTRTSSTNLSGSPLTTTVSDGVGSASAGLVGVHAGVAVNTTGGYLNSGHGTASAVASWGDGVIINKAGLTGSKGYLSATLILDGDLFVQAFGQNASNLERAFATVSVTGEGLTTVSGYVPAGGCLSGSAYCAYAFAGASDIYGAPGNGTYKFGSGTLSVYIPFTFGQEFYLSYTMKAEAKAQAISWDGTSVAGAATGMAAFAHTLAWGGIDSIVYGGNQVEDFTLTSGSGFDYRLSAAAAVPEPETYAMMLAGLGLVAYAVRRRKRSDESR